MEQSKSLPIHVRNLQLLMTDFYKTEGGLNPPFMKEIFMQRNISNSQGMAMTLNCQKYEQRPLELSPLLTLEINCGRFYRKK